MAWRSISSGIVAALSSMLLLTLTATSIAMAPGAQIAPETAGLPGPAHNGTQDATAYHIFVGMERTGTLRFHGSPPSLADHDLYITDASSGAHRGGGPPSDPLHHLPPARHDMDMATGRAVLTLDGHELVRHGYSIRGTAFSYEGDPVPTEEACEPGLRAGDTDPHRVCRRIDPQNETSPFVVHVYSDDQVKPMPTRPVTGYVFTWSAPAGADEGEQARDALDHMLDRREMYFTALDAGAVEVQRVLVWGQWVLVACLLLAAGAVVVRQVGSRPRPGGPFGSAAKEQAGPTESLLLLMERATAYLARLRRNHVFWAAAMGLLLLLLAAARLVWPDLWHLLARVAPMGSWVAQSLAFLILGASTLLVWQAWQAWQVHQELLRVRHIIDAERAL